MASMEIVCMTPPYCLPTSSFPFFFLLSLPPTPPPPPPSTPSMSHDPKGEMLHSVDYFHLVFPHERHSLTLLLSLFISFFGLFVLLSPEHENWTPTSVVVMFMSALWSSGMGKFAHWIRSRSHQPWSQWKQLTLHPALCFGNALTYRLQQHERRRTTPVTSPSQKDYSAVVCIGTMPARYSDSPSMTWYEMDIWPLLFPDASFEVILEKAALDGSWKRSHSGRVPLRRAVLCSRLSQRYSTSVRKVLYTVDIEIHNLKLGSFMCFNAISQC